jgi:hypothetical protein
MIPLAFHGGTALRFLYAMARYSEDLDFALESARSQVDLRAYLRAIQTELQAEGYAVTIRVSDRKAVHSAWVRFPGLLYELDLSPHRDETLAVKLEVDTNPPDPTGEVLGYFFGASEPTARRTVKRVLLALEAAGRATFRWPNRKRGRSLPEILEDCPEVAVIIDGFEQRIGQVPRKLADHMVRLALAVIVTKLYGTRPVVPSSRLSPKGHSDKTIACYRCAPLAADRPRVAK